MYRRIFFCFVWAWALVVLLSGAVATHAIAQSSDALPIADAHVHYSHDSVELTPPERVIELMREANLKLALVSSSDDNGTQLLSELAPNLIVPGLRPYRRRGETGTWFRDPAALDYVEALLARNRYASIGEFHLYGEDADLDIPRRIVELAVEHNLILHAHSDADAVTRLLAQSPTIKVLWAHSGFDGPAEIAAMLEKHDRLWADLAFRSDVGSGGKLSDEWKALFEAHPDRMMLGTDTYTPERMYFIPSHAEAARGWLKSLSDELAERVAWKNAHELLMPVWVANRQSAGNSVTEASSAADKTAQKTAHKTAHKTADNSPTSMRADVVAGICGEPASEDTALIEDEELAVHVQPVGAIAVSKPVQVLLTVCGSDVSPASVTLDASMPAHGHGMNYNPEYTVLAQNDVGVQIQVDGIVLHMPGIWQWSVALKSGEVRKTLTHEFTAD